MARRFLKSDVERHSAHYGPPFLPAVDVKCRERFGGSYAYSIDDNPRAERALGWCWESHVELFWELATEYAAEIFGPKAKLYSAGRSGGWAVVSGLPDVEEWDAIAVSRWARFARMLEAERAHFCSADAVRETIEANDWLAPTPQDRIADAVKSLGVEEAARVLDDVVRVSNLVAVQRGEA